jgi:endonuclease YncB( thermonuclease family)
LEGEWKLWAGVGAIILATVVMLYLMSRPPKEGSEYLKQVTKIVDERTLTLRGAGQTVEFRFIGLDIPDARKKAVRDLLKNTLLEQWVRTKAIGDETKPVMEGFVYISGEDVHARIIRQGLATVDRGETRFDVSPYVELELEAKREKRGLWGGPQTGAQ